MTLPKLNGDFSSGAVTPEYRSAHDRVFGERRELPLCPCGRRSYVRDGELWSCKHCGLEMEEDSE